MCDVVSLSAVNFFGNLFALSATTCAGSSLMNSKLAASVCRSSFSLVITDLEVLWKSSMKK